MSRERPSEGRKRIEDIQATQARLYAEAENNRKVLGVLWGVEPPSRGTITRVQQRQAAVMGSINRNRVELHVLWDKELGGGDSNGR